jgi:hypothetical protein
VVVGLLFEAPEIWHDTVHSIRGFFQPRAPENLAPPWVKLIGIVGWILIVVGVAGEFVAESFVSKADGLVRKFDEIVLAETQNKSSEAFERAASAYARAAQTEQEAGQENERAAKSLEAAELARKEAEGFQLQIAKANERAADAERETARLMQKLADRILSPEQQKRVQTKVDLFPGTPYELAASDVPEATRLVVSIDNILHSAGWLYKPSESKVFRFVFTLSNGDQAEVFHGSGVEIGLTKSLMGKYNSAAGALQRALSAEGIETAGRILPDDDPSPNAIHITIGSKP